MNYSKLIYLTLFLILSLLTNDPQAILDELYSSPSPTPIAQVKSATSANVLVTRVVDGDTIELETGEKLRYIGINTPETKDTKKEVECFGLEAYQKNKELVEGKQVRLEKDVSNTDRYGRLLRYVYLDDVMINQLLVEEGYAQASAYPPDVKYQNLFDQAEIYARENQLGLWGDRCEKIIEYK